jgi:hypothetical protein
MLLEFNRYELDVWRHKNLMSDDEIEQFYLEQSDNDDIQELNFDESDS